MFKHGTKVGREVKMKYHSKASFEVTYPLNLKKQSSTNKKRVKKKNVKKSLACEIKS